MFAYRHVLYRLYNGHDVLLYIGRTVDIHKRLSRHARLQPWWHEVTSCRVEFMLGQPQLIAAERSAILQEQPKYNYQHNRQARVEVSAEDLARRQWASEAWDRDMAAAMEGRDVCSLTTPTGLP